MRGFLDWFLRDRTTGRIVVAQWPNLPLWLFALAAGAAWTLRGPGRDLLPATAAEPVVRASEAAALVTLAWWALDEVIRGVNPWRRCLGGAVLLMVLARTLLAL